jgi:hypothetical protein
LWSGLYGSQMGSLFSRDGDLLCASYPSLADSNVQAMNASGSQTAASKRKLSSLRPSAPLHRTLRRETTVLHWGLSVDGVEAIGTGPTPHDLRRTAASMMTAGGIPRLYVDRLLNHVDSSVGAIYDRHDYMAEKRHAAVTWSAKLRAIASGEPRRRQSNVIALRSPDRV